MQAQVVPHTNKVSQQMSNNVCNYKMVAASFPPSEPLIRISFVAHLNKKHTEKGILGNAVHLNQLTNDKVTRDT